MSELANMASNNGARLVRSLMLFCMISFVSGSANQVQTGSGFLFANLSRVPRCFQAPANPECPTLSHQVLDYDSKVETFKLILANINVTVGALQHFSASSQCEHCVRGYSCANTLLVCQADAAGRLTSATFNSNESLLHCQRAKSHCSKEVATKILHDCKYIMRDPRAFQLCLPIPTVQGDLCPPSSFKYQKPFMDMYAEVVANLNDEATKMGPLLRPPCLDNFKKMFCEMKRGPICSNDGKLRMYATSRQQCAQLLNNCFSRLPYIKDMCRVFPDENSAEKVPLP